MNHNIDVLVIGAGPSGTVAASIIHQARYKVLIVEKTKFPRFVIGESLLPRCMEALDEANMIDAVKEKNFQEKFGAKFVKNGKVCDFLFADQFTSGWKWTWQVPRAEFDLALADKVEEMGVQVMYETTVTAIKFNGTESETKYIDNACCEHTIKAKFIVDASGYGRVIPKLFNLDRPSSQPERKALFTHTYDINRSMDDEPNRITIIVHKPGMWVWVIPFSNGVTSLGFVGDPSFFKHLKGNNDEQLRELISSEPYLAQRFKDVKFAFNARVLEGWSSTTDKFYGDGFVLTGNVTEFLDPIFSSGVTLATVSSQRAANLVVRHLNGESINWDSEYMQPVMQGVNTFKTYVNAWYDGTLDKIFFSERQVPEIKNKICSVLAGYVWDQSNPFVTDHENELKKLVRIIGIEAALNEG